LPAPSPRSFGAALAAALSASALAAASAGAATVPDEVVVGYHGSTAAHVLHTTRVASTIRRLRTHADVRYAVRNVVARSSAAYLPDDPGRGTKPGRWAAVQWNFTGPAGVNAPDAWAHLIADGRPGGKGVKVAVLDTGVAYRQFGRTPASPDLAQTHVISGYDFIGHDQYANDRNGHGTHVASTIAEATNNAIGLTGLAYGASIMPVKVLDDAGEGRRHRHRRRRPLRRPVRRPTRRRTSRMDWISLRSSTASTTWQIRLVQHAMRAARSSPMAFA